MESDADNPRSPTDTSLVTMIPDESEIRRLIYSDPLKILAFINRLFHSLEHPTELKVGIAESLLALLDGESRIHVWEALCGVARQGASGCHCPLFRLAKNTLSARIASQEETSAIRDLLSDLRIFNVELTAAPDEASRFCAINQFARCCRRDELGATVRMLGEASQDDSFLIRESAAEGIGVIGTRSDFEDSDILPFAETCSEILRRLSADVCAYVRFSATTVLAIFPEYP